MPKMSIQALKVFLDKEQPGPDELQRLMDKEERKGARAVIAKYIKERQKEAQEKVRQEKLLLYENRAWNRGYELVAGVDEAGRGPLAGPVVAAAVILPRGTMIPGLDDSKKLSAAKRESLYDDIMGITSRVGIGMVEAGVIDMINIYQASVAAMKKAITNLPVKPDYVLVDAIILKGLEIPHQAITKGDNLSLSIAAASVVAKVTRDRLMQKLDTVYPGYGLAGHKGYGTREHFAALQELGLSPIHRQSFNLQDTRYNIQDKRYKIQDTRYKIKDTKFKRPEAFREPIQELRAGREQDKEE